MGADQSKAQAITYEEFEKKYERHSREANDIQVLREKGSVDKFIALREFSFSDEEHFLNIYKKFEPRKQLDHQNIIKLFHVFQHKESNFCSTFYKVFLIFEHVDNTLEKEIQNRLSLQQRFSEEELWNIISQCILGLDYLYGKNLSHANLSTSSIFITQEGAVQVSEPSLIGSIPTYNRILTSQTSSFPGDYFAPELLAALYEQQLHPNYNQSKSDVFTLGMVGIQAALLKPLDDAYDYQACTIDQRVLIERLQEVQSIYGSNLANLLASMTNIDVNSRCDIQTICNSLNNQPQEQQAQNQPEQPPVEEVVKRAPAQPQVRQAPQQQVQQVEQVNQVASGTNAVSMFRDADDNGSTNFYPQDRVSKAVVPDENSGNAIGAGSSTVSGSNYNNNNNISNQYPDSTREQTQSYTQWNTKVNLYDANYGGSQYNPFTQYQPASTNVLTQQKAIIQPAVQEEAPKRSAPAPVYSAAAVIEPVVNQNETTQSQFLLRGPIPPVFLEETSQSGVYISTKDQEIQRQQLLSNLPVNAQSQFQPISYTQSTTSYTNNYAPSTSYVPTTYPKTSNNYTATTTTTNSYQIKDNNFTYTPGPATIASSTVKQTGEQEDVVKRSAPVAQTTTVPLVNSYVPQANYSVTSVVNNNSTDIQVPPEIQKQSDDIELILQKFRNQQLTQQNAGTTTTAVAAPAPPVQEVVKQSTVVPSYVPSTTTTDYLSQFKAMSIQPNNNNNSYSNNVEYQQSTQNISAPPPTQTYIPSSNANANIYNLGGTSLSNYQPSSVNYSLAPTNLTYQVANPQFANYGSSQQQAKEVVVESYTNNSRYEGEKMNGMRNGHGKFYYQDGGLFDGEWQDNKMHGKGVLSYASGKPAYSGDWVDDKFEGNGTLYNENPFQFNQEFNYTDFDNVDEYWTHYEGEFKDDNKEGYGTLYLSNGERYVGQFYKDFVNGQGTFYNIYGQAINGYWQENKLIQ